MLITPVNSHQIIALVGCWNTSVASLAGTSGSILTCVASSSVYTLFWFAAILYSSNLYIHLITVHNIINNNNNQFSYGFHTNLNSFKINV